MYNSLFSIYDHKDKPKVQPSILCNAVKLDKINTLLKACFHFTEEIFI